MKIESHSEGHFAHRLCGIAGVYLTVLAGLFLCAPWLHAGGPLKVAGVNGFDPGTAGTALTWSQGAVLYYTDQGDLSPALTQAEANAFVADAFLRWTSVSTAALSATRAGQLDEDVNGGNVIFVGNGQVNIPADIQPGALAKPVAIVYDTDGKVTDALLGQGAGGADMCSSNAVYGGPDNYTADAHLSHALVVLNGNCAQTSAALPDLKYHLIRVLGRVLGLDWVDLNSNVFTGQPSPTGDDYLGYPVMHALEPVCAASSVCFTAAEQLKMDDRATISRLYPVTSANLANFSGKQVFHNSTARIHGSIYFRGRNGLAAQPMQGVKVVARWIDPGTGLPSRRYTMASVSGFLFRGNAGNAATGFSDASGERYDKFGSGDPGLEGYFDLAGLEFPDGAATAQYQITVETVHPLCSETSSVGPYRGSQVAPSGVATPITVMVSRGDELTREVVMAGSALSANQSASSFATPARLSASGSWAGSLSPYGKVDYYSLAAHGKRTLTVKVTALNEAGKVTQNKALPVIGIWDAAAATGSPPLASAFYFNSAEAGTTLLNALLPGAGNFKLGIADFRGDGRPDFRYRARVFYGDSVAPQRVSVQSGAALTVRGIGLGASTTAKINGMTAAVIAAVTDRIVLAAPSVPDGTYNLDLKAADGATSSMVNALTYGATAGDQIVLLQGGANPATPAGGEAPNPIRVRVLQADGSTPVAGAKVSFSSSSGGVVFSRCGSSSCSLITDEQGEASSSMMPTAAGTFTVTAAISASASVSTSVTATSPALAISAISQSVWVAQGGSGSLPLTARVLANGQPVASRSVRYSVTQGTASLSSATGVTDAQGYATTSLTVSSLAAGINASACVMPSASPCSNFYIYVVPASALRLQYLAGDLQTINTAQSFSPVRLRVVESASLVTVQMATVMVLTAVFRWQAPPVVTGLNLPPPPPPVVLASTLATVYSGSEGIVTLTPSAAASFGAVVVKVIAWAGTGLPLQFELQRLWAPAGWVAPSTADRSFDTSPLRPSRLTFSPRYLPTD